MESINKTLVSAKNKQICLGIGSNFLILPVRVHSAIEIITPAKINIINSFRLQSMKNAAIKPAKVNQFENFNLSISLYNLSHDLMRISSQIS